MPDKGKTRKSKGLMGYQDMPIGGLILDAGNSVKYKTGQWRTKDFHINKDKCSNCMLCFIYCPEKCVKLNGFEISKIELDYCKGCGICAAECPKNAIDVRSK
ncbi:4Fe-4S binding protein [Actinomycetota bacterium]